MTLQSVETVPDVETILAALIRESVMRDAGVQSQPHLFEHAFTCLPLHVLDDAIMPSASRPAWSYGLWTTTLLPTHFESTHDAAAFATTAQAQAVGVFVDRPSRRSRAVPEGVDLKMFAVALAEMLADSMMRDCNGKAD